MNESDGAWAWECMSSCRWVSWGTKHDGTVTATIVVSLVILSIMGFRIFEVKIDGV